MTAQTLSATKAAEQAARILRDAMAADARGKSFTDQRDRMVALQKQSADADALLESRAWALFDDFRHPNKRLDAPLYVTELSALTLGGHGPSTAVLLERLQPTLEACAIGDLATCFDSHQTVTRHIKRAKWNTKECATFVCSNANALYGTALIDWAVEALPIGKLKGILALLLAGEPRPAYLSSAGALLRRMVERDRQAALLKMYVVQGAHAEGHATQVMRALVAVAPTGPVWATAISSWLRSAGMPDRKAVFVSLMEEALQAGREGGFQRIAAFVAAIIANVVNGAEIAKVAERQRVADLVERLVSASSAMVHASRSERVWYCASSGEQTMPRLKPTEGMNRGIARHLASALRSKEQGNDVGKVLEALGVNLGLEPINAVGDVIRFDPERHEDESGGLLPGMQAGVLECGWSYAESVVLRARVKAL